jgi:hypothetical protein
MLCRVLDLIFLFQVMIVHHFCNNVGYCGTQFSYWLHAWFLKSCSVVNGSTAKRAIEEWNYAISLLEILTTTECLLESCLNLTNTWNSWTFIPKFVSFVHTHLDVMSHSWCLFFMIISLCQHSSWQRKILGTCMIDIGREWIYNKITRLWINNNREDGAT